MSNEYREPPEFDPTQIDLSEAHFLDHNIWQCGRRGKYEYGGRRQHLALRWEYQWRPRLIALTFCKVGKHQPTQFWRGNPPRTTWTGCCYCYKALSKPQPV